MLLGCVHPVFDATERLSCPEGDQNESIIDFENYLDQSDGASELRADTESNITSDQSNLEFYMSSIKQAISDIRQTQVDWCANFLISHIPDEIGLLDKRNIYLGSNRKYNEMNLASITSNSLKSSNQFQPYYVSFLVQSLLKSPEKNNNIENIYKYHLIDSFRSINLMKEMALASSDIASQLSGKSVTLGNANHPTNKKVLVLDLDETLIHCSTNINSAKSDADIQISIKDTNNESSLTVGINVRPFAVQFIKQMSQFFDIVVFTASQQNYADQVLDWLDPNNKYIKLRLYRNNCIQVNKYYIKDLRIFQNCDLKDLVIVDNSCLSFIMNLDNGIPIIPYYDDKSDCELLQLIPLLMQLVQARDVRQILKKSFKFHLFQNYRDLASLAYELYLLELMAKKDTKSPRVI